MEASKDRICLGLILGASGVKGEVRIKPYTARPDGIAAYGPVETKDGSARFEVEVVRAGKDNLVIARLDGVDERDAAEALGGTEFYIDRALLPGKQEDEYYHADLVGLSAQDLAGATLGRVTAVHDFGAGEILEVGLEKGGVALIPFTLEAVPQVLVSQGQVVINPPDGVLPKPKAQKRQTGAKSGKRKVKSGSGAETKEASKDV